MIQCFSSPSIHPFPFSISTVRIGKMSRDKAVLPMLKCHPARPIFCRVLCCLYLLYISQSCSVDISIPIFPLVILFVMLCRSCCLSLSPAVSLSGPGVGFLTQCYGSSLGLGPSCWGLTVLLHHQTSYRPIPSSFFLLSLALWTLAYTNSSSRPFPSACFSHHIYDILCRGNSL